MSKRARFLLLAAALTGSGLTVAGPESARAAVTPDHTIQVGALNPENPALSTYNYMRFYPGHLQVHRGQTIQWRWAAAGYFGWHSVSFLPRDMDVAAHPDGLESAIPPAFRRDELGLAFTERWVFGHGGSPTGASTCGRGPWRNLPAQPDCTLSDTDQLLSSSISDTFFNMPGAPQNITWNVKIDLPLGAYRYRCLVHPGMDGTLQVVPPENPLRPAADIAVEVAAQIQRDTDAADLAAAEKSDPRNAYDRANREWVVNVGAETPDRRVGIYSFLPSHLDLNPGERVRFEAHVDEPNTVTFPPDGAGTFGPPHQGCTPTKCGQGTDPPSQLPGYGLSWVAFPFVCDPDDPAAGVPGFTPVLVRATWSCAIGNVEWLVAPHMAGPQRAPDDEVLTRATFHNSGALMADTAPQWYAGPFDEPAPREDIERIPSTFKARFPNAGTYPYVCLAHPDFMTGSVRVA